MPPSFPYTFYSCPCSEIDTTSVLENGIEATLDEEHSFNPHDPQTAFSLYTLEYLLFCDECNQIRCPKCVSDEIINWYCPNCLFEVPSSGVKSEGNRCSRNCYSCPVCTAPLTVSQLESKDEETKSDDDTYILTCQYCAWTSLDIDVTFTRSTKITDQLNKTYKERHGGQEADQDSVKDGTEHKRMSSEERYQKLLAFYKAQLMEGGEQSSTLGYGSYGSPANLARIINLYGGLSHTALKKSQEKPQPMREAKPEEGLSIHDVSQDQDVIQRMAQLGWDGTISQEQRISSPANYEVKLKDDLWPVAVHLRTRRGKRCRQCRQFVIRPDSKIGSTRYRLRIIALNHIPRLLIRPLESSRPLPNPSFILRNDQPVEENILRPYVTKQYVLTLRNPIFEPVKVTLATPAVTPGKVQSKVTILCPSFTIGPAGDVWDDALSKDSPAGHGDGGRRAAMASLTGGETDRQPEAGKIWEQSRNSTSVVLEIVPGATKPVQSIVPGDDKEEEQLGEDDCVLEVPIYVRVEWMAEVTAEGEQKGTAEKVPRELAYWSVLGIGRIAES